MKFGKKRMKIFLACSSVFQSLSRVFKRIESEAKEIKKSVSTSAEIM